MILAGDVGGTKTLIGVFDASLPRPHLVAVSAYPTLRYASLTAIVSTFVQERALRLDEISSASFGVAGPVLGTTAQLTNVPWGIDAPGVELEIGIPRVSLLNDLEAMAYALPVLGEDELHVLQSGQRDPSGHLALIAAGTGLGEAFVHNIDGRFLPSASEGGHADWAARGERDVEVLRSLIQRYGRAEVEQVVSGPGLVNLFVASHATPCTVVLDETDADAPAAISAAALSRRCKGCMDALDLFVAAFGAEAGNLALRTLATGGLFVGGGIAPKILPALTDGRFMRAFLDKAPFTALLERVPVSIILAAEAGLLGAAVYAAGRH